MKGATTSKAARSLFGGHVYNIIISIAAMCGVFLLCKCNSPDKKTCIYYLLTYSH